MEDLTQLSKEQLIKKLLQARAEIQSLKAQKDGKKEAVADERVYDLSMNVMVVGGNAEHRKLRTVPLQQILNSSTGRDYTADADTPVYGSGRRHEWIGQGRLSAGSVQSDESPTRQSTVLASLPSVTPERPRPPGLKLAKPHLDSDAIVSGQTLHSFSTMYGGSSNVHSPQFSASSTSILQYLNEEFTRRGNYSHNPDHLESFGRTLINVCGDVEAVLRSESNYPTIPSPCYVFGDIHGNFRDMHYFLEDLLNFHSASYTPYRFLFLGDYVDRGAHSVEVVAYLLALKLSAPDKVFLLRGNHEDTLVNGDQLYGETSFKRQAHKLFGPLLGEEVWKRCNRAFVHMPLCANIDNKIFCTHGGLPRYEGGADNRLEVVKNPQFPKYESFFLIPEKEENFVKQCRQIASDICWSDPAEDESALNEYGFGPNPRGNGVILFGSKAVDTFLENYGYEFIFRAHQEKADGLKVSKNARVITIFSTSSYVGHDNGAGVVFVGDGKIRLIIKHPDEEE